MKTQNFKSLCLIFVLVGFLVASVPCCAQNLIFPETIIVNQEVKTGYSPWEIFRDDIPLQLMSVTIYDGHPKDRVALVPDAETRKERKQVRTWHLIPNKSRTYWICCAYDRTNITLARPLDPTVSICEVTYDTQISVGGHPSVLEIKCK